MHSWPAVAVGDDIEPRRVDATSDDDTTEDTAAAGEDTTDEDTAGADDDADAVAETDTAADDDTGDGMVTPTPIPHLEDCALSWTTERTFTNVRIWPVDETPPASPTGHTCALTWTGSIVRDDPWVPNPCFMYGKTGCDDCDLVFWADIAKTHTCPTGGSLDEPPESFYMHWGLDLDEPQLYASFSDRFDIYGDADGEVTTTAGYLSTSSSRTSPRDPEDREEDLMLADGTVVHMDYDGYDQTTEITWNEACLEAYAAATGTDVHAPEDTTSDDDTATDIDGSGTDTDADTGIGS